MSSRTKHLARVALLLVFYTHFVFAVGFPPEPESPSQYQSVFNEYRDQLLKKGMPSDAIATAGISSGGGSPDSQASCHQLTISQRGKPIGTASICTSSGRGLPTRTDVLFRKSSKDLIAENTRTPCPSKEKPALPPGQKKPDRESNAWFCASRKSFEEDFSPEVSALLADPKFHKALMDFIADQKKHHNKVRILGSTLWFNGSVASVGLRVAVKSELDPKATWADAGKIASPFEVSSDGKITFERF